jgi:hypothetical protein
MAANPELIKYRNEWTAHYESKPNCGGKIVSSAPGCVCRGPCHCMDKCECQK